MAETAGVPVQPERYELNQVDGDVFVLTDPSGAAVRAAAFLGSDATGRARFLHTGRAAPRTD